MKNKRICRFCHKPTSFLNGACKDCENQAKYRLQVMFSHDEKKYGPASKEWVKKMERLLAKP